jgi:hypothetical protein
MNVDFYEVQGMLETLRSNLEGKIQDEHYETERVADSIRNELRDYAYKSTVEELRELVAELTRRCDEHIDLINNLGARVAELEKS